MTPDTPPKMTNLPGTEGLFAANTPFQSLEFYLAVGSLVGVLLVAAVILEYMEKWSKKQLKDEDDSPMTLSSYRQLYEQGELSEEEYARVRERLAAKMKQTGAKKSRVTGTPPPTQSANDPKPPKLPDPEAS